MATPPKRFRFGSSPINDAIGETVRRGSAETGAMHVDTLDLERIEPDPDLGGRPDGRRRADQVTCPYGAILRVDFLPHLAEKKVGFRMSR